MNKKTTEITRQQQIRRKLSTVRESKELIPILKSVQNQNKKLVVEIKQFRERIERIRIESNRAKEKAEQDRKKQEKNNKQLESHVKSARKQLAEKYKTMKELKLKLAQNSDTKVEEIENDRMKNVNEINSRDKEISELKKELKDLQVVQQRLVQTQNERDKEINTNMPRIKQLQEQNKQLRDKMGGIRRKEYQELGYSIEVQEKLITNRQKFRQNSVKTLKTSSLPQIAQNSKINQSALIEVKKLQVELQMLKQKVTEREESDEVQVTKKKKQKNDLLTRNRELMKKNKDFQLKKVKIIQENNMWKSRWLKICQGIQAHKNKLKKNDMGTQHEEYEDMDPLRRDYAGVISKLRFEDRQILKEDKQCKIVGLMVYEIEKWIVTVQAIYSNGLKSYIPIPDHYLQRCKITRAQTTQHDFFKLFKIKYNSNDNKIKKLEIRSNKNIKYQYGEKKAWGDFEEGDMIYGFDIGVREYPVCIFGSYSYWKGSWFLEGFGVEINEIKE